MSYTVSIHRHLPTPAGFPALAAILDDLGHPQPQHIARALGVNTRTVQRWISTGTAPQPCLVALFWLTRWGMDAVSMEARNDARMFAGQVRTLQAEVTRLRHELARVVNMADFGTANAPLLELLPVPERAPPRPALQLVVA